MKTVRSASKLLRKVLVIAVLPSALVVTPAVAHAQPESPAAANETTEAAREHFLRGVQFYNNGDFKLSLVEFRRSYELSRNYRLLFNIGQVNHQLNNYTKALRALEEYLTVGGAEVPEARRAEVESAILELRRKTAKLQILVNVPNAAVYVDDELVERTAPGASIVIDAGDHRVSARVPGYEPASAAVTLVAGEASQVRLTLRRVAAPVTQHVAPAAPIETGRSPWVWGSWGGTGVLAAGAAVTGIMAGSAASELAELRNSPDSSAGERASTADRARTFATVSDVLTVSTLALGGLSTYLTLSSGKRETPPSSPRPGTSISHGPTALGLSLVHRY